MWTPPPPPPHSDPLNSNRFAVPLGARVSGVLLYSKNQVILWVYPVLLNSTVTLFSKYYDISERHKHSRRTLFQSAVLNMYTNKTCTIFPNRMNHPLHIDRNNPTHPFPVAQNLMTYPLSAPAHTVPKN